MVFFTAHPWGRPVPMSNFIPTATPDGATNSVHPMGALSPMLTSTDWQAIDSLTPLERQWLERQIQEGARPLLLLAAIRSMWQHSLKPKMRLPSPECGLVWWTSWVASRPVAFGLGYKDG